MTFYVIGDADTVLGFRLAGVSGEVVESPEQGQEALERAFKMEDLGVIILSERIAASIRETVDRYVFKTSFPLVIEIPDRKGALEGRGSVRDLIRSAVGVHI